MNDPATHQPAEPRLPETALPGQRIIETRQVTSGCLCTYDVRLIWDGKSWQFLSGRYCRHGFTGLRTLAITPDSGQPLTLGADCPQGGHALRLLIDYAEDTRDLRSLAVIKAFARP